MTIVSLAIVVVQQWREIGPLRAQNKRLNEERGTLVIGDLSKLHAIKVPARFAGEGRQSFRVYVPPGSRYIAFVQVNNVPKDGVPERTRLSDYRGILGGSQGQLFARLDPGEHMVTIRTVRRGDRSDIKLVVGFASPAVTLDASANTPKDRWPTVTPETYYVFGGGVQARTVAVKGSHPLVLRRQRIMGVARDRDFVSYTTPEPNLPLDGVLLWVQRAQ